MLFFWYRWCEAVYFDFLYWIIVYIGCYVVMGLSFSMYCIIFAWGVACLVKLFI